MAFSQSRWEGIYDQQKERNGAEVECLIFPTTNVIVDDL